MRATQAAQRSSRSHASINAAAVDAMTGLTCKRTFLLPPFGAIEATSALARTRCQIRRAIVTCGGLPRLAPAEAPGVALTGRTVGPRRFMADLLLRAPSPKRPHAARIRKVEAIVREEIWAAESGERSTEGSPVMRHGKPSGVLCRGRGYRGDPREARERGRMRSPDLVGAEFWRTPARSVFPGKFDEVLVSSAHWGVRQFFEPRFQHRFISIHAD